VKNRSLNAWNEVYAGFFLDWDVGGGERNTAGFDPEAELAWVSSPAPGMPWVGIAAVHDAWGAFYVVDNRAEMDAPNAWSDERKWNVLRQGITSPLTDAKDISLQVAVGPLSIAAQAERNFAFALVAGSDVNDLRAQADAARSHYAAGSPEPGYIEAVIPERAARLVPNPLRQGEKLRLIVPQEEMVTVKIYNLLGQKLTEIRNIKAGPEGVGLNWTIPNQASGLLIYRIESSRKTTVGKLLLLR